MPSPRSAPFGLDDVNDYDLDDLGCTLDIVHEIDKFLEGLTSDGPDLPVNNDKQIENSKIDEIKTADLQVVDNNKTATNQIDVEYVGKDSAVFQLLEDHENYGVYEHNPNECNWNVFYKTLPPDEQKFVKIEPKTEIVNDYFNADLETFSFNLDNTQEKSTIKQHSSEAFSSGAATSDISYSDNELANFSFTLKADHNKEKSTIKQHSSEAFSSGAATSDISYSDNELANFSFTLKSDNNKDNLPNAEVKRWKPYKKCKYSNPKSNAPIPHLFRNNNYKNTFRKPNPWYRKDSTQRNSVFQQTLKKQHQGNISLLSATNNNSSTYFQQKNYNLQSNRGNSNNFKKTPNEIQGNNNFAHSTSFTKNSNELINFQFGKNNSQFVPKYIENPTLNAPRQTHISPEVPISKPHGIVGEYLCPVSLVGTTIKFLSRKLANTSMREQIIIELATFGILENNWWTPDDMFYATFTERSIAQHVFKVYPHNSKSSY